MAIPPITKVMVILGTRLYVKLLQSNRNLTDREMSEILGYQDPNKVRPRRNELVKKQLLIEDEKRICSIGHKLSIAWKLNPEQLYHYMRN